MATYTITLTPADQTLSTAVRLTLFGAKGTSAEFQLRERRPVRANSHQVEVICDLGDMQLVRVSYASPVGPSAYLDGITVQEVGTLRSWHFPCRIHVSGFGERMLDPEPARLAA